MSVTTCPSWRASQIFSVSMGRNNLRSVGTVGHKRRLQTRISQEASFFRHYQYNCSRYRKKYYIRRNSHSFVKRCYRKGTSRTEPSRFLQYLIFSSKEKRQNETGDKFKTTQSVSLQEAFQNGHISQSIEFSKTKRLGSLNRSERCLSSYSNIPCPQKISEVLFSRSMLPMESHVFWTDSGTSCVHKNSVSSSSILENIEHTPSSVSRRLAELEPVKTFSTSRSSSDTRSPDQSRIHCKSRKVQSDSSTKLCVHRDLVQSQSRVSTTDNGKTRENTTCRLVIDEWSYNSKGLSETARHDGVLHRTNSACSSVHETNSASSVVLLETFKTSFGHGDSIFSTSKGSFEMVAKFSQHYERPVTSPVIGRNDTHNRCFENHVRRICGRQLRARGMDRGTVKTTHKSVGVESSSFMPETLHTKISGKDCSSKIRQYHSGTVHQQTRGYKIEQSMHRGMESLAVCNSKQCSVESRSSARSSQLPSRSTESPQSTEHRVDFMQDSSSVNISGMGYTNNGSLCIPTEHSDTSFLFMVSKQSSICTTCVKYFMGEHICLCLPSNMSDPQSSESHPSVQLSSNSHCTTVATQTLVSRSVGSSNSSSNETSDQARFVDTTWHSNLSSKARTVQSHGMASVCERFQEIGFSQKSRKLLMAAWRKGTQQDYTSKFKLYDSWCSSRKIDPYSATVTQVADFIAYLFDRGLQYSTINGYRSMLSAVLPCIDGHKVGQHPYVIQMMKGVFNSRPPQVKLVPEWDLFKVLDALQKKPFEPLHKASLKLLTLKTVFMIAITSFRRCSDLQSFRLGQDSVNIQSKGITFIRHGLAKQDRQSHRKATVFIPAFPENKKLDPKRCIYYYLKATEKFRKTPGGVDETKVFLGLNEPHKPVSAQTISHWIVQALRICLNDSKMKVRAHSTRAIGPSLALFKGASVESIMRSADWSSETTFVRSYLRDLNCNVLKD